MQLEQALQLINDELHHHLGRKLSDVETIVLQGSWERQTYEEIANTAGYSNGYLQKDVGPKLWRDLTVAMGEPLSKTNFRSALERHREKRLQVSHPLTHDYPDQKTDWGEAVDVSIFFGRSIEQETLRQWVIADRCRFILLLGMGGIGKTALAIKLGQHVQADFEFVIWRSLRNAPPILNLLGDLIQFISQQQDIEIPNTDDAASLLLLQYLRNHRCLLILDNAEAILQAGDPSGRYRSGYEGYGLLFRRAGETAHLSCLIVTSRERPQNLGSKFGSGLPIRCLTIGGLSHEDGQTLLNHIGQFSGADSEWKSIINRYAGNPLALKIMASFASEVFGGDFKELLSFLGHSSSIFGDIRDLLDQQFHRLSPQEKEVMIWLAIKREPVLLQELLEDLFPPCSPPQLLQILSSLRGRSLIEKNELNLLSSP